MPWLLVGNSRSVIKDTAKVCELRVTDTISCYGTRSKHWRCIIVSPIGVKRRRNDSLNTLTLT